MNIFTKPHCSTLPRIMIMKNSESDQVIFKKLPVKDWRWENLMGEFLGLVYTNSKSPAKHRIPNQNRPP